MNKKFEIRKLSKVFYAEYDEVNYPEIERKKSRPYIVVLIRINNNTFAIPLRTNIKHNACYKFYNSGRRTKYKTGLDFSKAVIVNDKKYLGKKVKIDQKEYLEISERFYFIFSRFKKYVSNYYRFAIGNMKSYEKKKYQYTTLKYFHKELGIK